MSLESQGLLNGMDIQKENLNLPSFLFQCYVNKDSLKNIFLPKRHTPLPTALSRTSNKILQRSGERGHPCFAPDLSGNVSSFSPLCILVIAFS